MERDFFIRRSFKSRKLCVKQLLLVPYDATTAVSNNRHKLKWIYVPALKWPLQQYTTVCPTNLNIKN